MPSSKQVAKDSESDDSEDDDEDDEDDESEVSHSINGYMTNESTRIL